MDFLLSAFTFSAVTGVFLSALTLLLLVPACTNVWWQMHAWRTPRVHASITGRVPADRRRTSFSAIVPFRHEAEDVVRETVARLLDQTHDAVEIVLSVGHDDPPSITIAHRLAHQWPDAVTVSVDAGPVKNKPRQLNAALRECSGAYVAVIDAESLTHPELFDQADALLGTTGCDVLQCGVQLVNHRTTWFSLRNCLEYFFWFRSRLHLHARHGFIPLGGNTVFIKRSLLEELGGWDERALTEDCELGVRLSSHGVSVAVAYDPRLVTREETPDTVGALIRQRSRWNQGFLQVLAKGEWRRLPTRRQRLLARYTLLQPFFQAVTFAALLIAVVAAMTVQLPLPLAMLTFLPLAPTLGMLLFECAALREFGRELELPIGARDYVRLVLSTVPYVTILGYAALRALLRQWGGRDDWEKTPHAGHHLVPGKVAGPAGIGEVRPA